MSITQPWCKRAQLSAHSHLSDGSHAAHGLSQGIQLLSLFCRYHFSFTICALNTPYIPGIVLGAGDWTVCKRTRFWSLELLYSGLRVPGRNSSMHLSPAFAAHHCLSCYSVPVSWTWFWFTPSCLFASFYPHSLCLFTCQRALFLPLCALYAWKHFPSSVTCSQCQHVLPLAQLY